MAYSFVGYSSADKRTGSSTISWPSGTTAGDIALIVILSNTGSVSGMSGFTLQTLGIPNSGSKAFAYFKVLTSGDVSSPPSYSGGSYDSWVCGVWRGPTAIAYKTVLASDGGTTCDVPGFVKAGDSTAVITYCVDRDTNATTITEPSGFTSRANFTQTYYRQMLADVAASGYTDSATITWSGLYNLYNQLGAAFELTGGATATGTLDATEAGDSTSAAGSVLVSGSASISEAADTVSAVGAVAIKAAASISEAADSVASTATVLVTASLSASEAGDSVASVAGVLVKGVLSATEADDTLSGAGLITDGPVAQVVQTEADDVVSSASTVLVSGTLDTSEADDALSASGSVLVSGSLDASEADDTLSSSGSVSISGSLTASANITENNDSLLAATTVRTPNTPSARSTGISIPWGVIVHRADPDFEKNKRRNLQYTFRRKPEFIADNAVIGPYATRAPSNVHAPTIRGGTVAGNVLTCNPGEHIGAPAPAITYQWQADGIDLPGEDSEKLMLMTEDVGSIITCNVTATNASGAVTTSTAATAAITART